MAKGLSLLTIDRIAALSARALGYTSKVGELKKDYIYLAESTRDIAQALKASPAAIIVESGAAGHFRHLDSKILLEVEDLAEARAELARHFA